MALPFSCLFLFKGEHLVSKIKTDSEYNSSTLIVAVFKCSQLSVLMPPGVLNPARKTVHRESRQVVCIFNRYLTASYRLTHGSVTRGCVINGIFNSRQNLAF